MRKIVLITARAVTLKNETKSENEGVVCTLASGSQVELWGGLLQKREFRGNILSSLTQNIPVQLSSEMEGFEMELAFSIKGSQHLSRTYEKRGNDFKTSMGNKKLPKF